MYIRALAIALTACICNSLSFAQSPDSYKAPRTEHGQPDLQGVWSTRFNTMLERPEGNYSMVGALRGARAQEARAAQGQKD